MNVLNSVFIGGMSGSGNADAAIDAKTLVPIMVQKGYSKPFAAAVTAASGVIAPIIPVIFQSFLAEPLYASEWNLTLGNYAELFTSPLLKTLVWNSLLFSVGTTLMVGLSVFCVISCYGRMRRSVVSECPAATWCGMT